MAKREIVRAPSKILSRTGQEPATINIFPDPKPQMLRITKLTLDSKNWSSPIYKTHQIVDQINLLR